MPAHLFSRSRSPRLRALGATLPGFDPARVHPLSRLRVQEVSGSPEVHPSLLPRWEELRTERLRWINASRNRFNGETVRVVGFDPAEGLLRWAPSDYASLLARSDLAASEGFDADIGISVSVLLGCAEGWVFTRRSRKVLNPGIWQHTAAEGLQPDDLRVPSLDVRAVARRALREECALDLPASAVLPWALHELPGPRTGLRLYVVADAVRVSYERLLEIFASAPDAWERDGTALVATGSDLVGRRLDSDLLLPALPPKELFALLRAS